MREALRLLGGPRAVARRPVLGGFALGCAAALCAAGLLGLSGWFIVMCTVPAFPYVIPSAGVRAFAIARVACRYGERMCTHSATLRLLAGLRTTVFAGAARSGRTFRSGDLLARITADVDALDLILPRLLVPAASGALTAAAGLAALALIAAPLAAGTAAGVLALAGLCLMARRAGRRTGDHLVAAAADARTRIVETVEGLPEIISYRAQDTAAAALQADLDRVERAVRRADRADARLTGAAHLVSGAALVGVFWLARTLGIPVALALLAALLATVLLEQLQPLPAAIRGLGTTRAAARRLTAITRPEPPAPAPDVPPLPGGGITLVTGPSGSGKSTLLRDLARAYDGAVLVAQDDHIFDDTIAGNLRLGRPDATPQQLAEALAAVALTGLLAELPEGLDTRVGPHGHTLSGGQRRRLALARAVLCRPPVLLLDEPTEGMDAETARHVLAGLRRLLPAATIVAAAHQRTPFPPAPDHVIHLPAAGAPEGPVSRDGHSLARPDRMARSSR